MNIKDICHDVGVYNDTILYAIENNVGSINRDDYKCKRLDSRTLITWTLSGTTCLFETFATPLFLRDKALSVETLKANDSYGPPFYHLDNHVKCESKTLVVSFSGITSLSLDLISDCFTQMIKYIALKTKI